MIDVIGLGAGVQSTVLYAMSCLGVLPRARCAVFADTGWERRATYGHLAFLEGWGDIPIVRLSGNGSVRDHAIRQASGEGGRFASMPIVTMGVRGKIGRVPRQCTREFKIEPVERYMRRTLLGLKPRQRAPKTVQIRHWFGITTDEHQRINPTAATWKEHVYPFCQFPGDIGIPKMSRQDCIDWLEEHGLPVPVRSSCVGCPLHSNEEWRSVKDSPAEWEDAVELDRAIRNSNGMDSQAFLHRKARPLEEVDLRTDEQRGQQSLWNDECSGMCGV